MTRHLRLECGVPPQFHCPHCDFQSTRKGSINAHIAVKHAVEAEKAAMAQGRYQCRRCKKLFAYKVALLKHRSECDRFSSSALPCPKCAFVAQRTSDLDKHIATAHFVL